MTPQNTSPISRFTAKCNREELRLIREYITTELEKLGIRTKLREQIVLAVDEASANAIIHGNDCDASRSIALELYFEADKISVYIFDVGKFEFDPTTINRDVKTLLKNRAKGGLGLRLIHALMDEVWFFEQDGIHVCAMTKDVA